MKMKSGVGGWAMVVIFATVLLYSLAYGAPVGSDCLDFVHGNKKFCSEATIDGKPVDMITLRNHQAKQRMYFHLFMEGVILLIIALGSSCCLCCCLCCRSIRRNLPAADVLPGNAYYSTNVSRGMDAANVPTTLPNVAS